MRFKFNRATLLKFACLLLVLIAVPLGAAELVFLIDLGGIDFAVTFLLMYFASMRDALRDRYQNLKASANQFIRYASELYMFQPKIFISHVSASSLLVVVTSSVFFACLLWVPLIYVSSGFVT